METIETEVTQAMQSVEDIVASLLHRAHAADVLPPIEFDDQGWAHGEDVACFRKPVPPQAPQVIQTSNMVPIPGTQMLTFAPTPPFLYETLKQQSLAPGLDHIEGVVWHYTDTRGCGADALAKRLLDPGNNRAASWSACIDERGHISQSVSAKCGSWHAGGSDAALFMRSADGLWTMLTPAQRGKVRGWSANSWAYGIELENAGELRLIPDPRGNKVWASWPFAFGTQYGAPIVVPNDEVAISPDGAHGWHRFTPQQVAGAQRLLAGLVSRYGLRREACAWTHKIIDPQNRTDPGPLWASEGGHLTEVLDAVFGVG